jgi:uncharacterized protein YkwD
MPEQAPRRRTPDRPGLPWAEALLAIGCLLPALAASAQEDRRDLALSLVNQARSAEGLDPLNMNDRLVAAAKKHATDMLERDYYAHVSPEGEDVRDRFLAEGGSEWLRVAENLAICRGCPTPPGRERVRSFQKGWMESAEHRDNILDPGLESFGYAVVAGEDTTYGVQTFAGPGRPEGLPPGEEERRASPEALDKAALQAVNEARGAAGLDALQRSAPIDAAAGTLTEAGAVSDEDGALGAALADEDGAWRSVGMLSGECGGCGTVPTAIDARNFVETWLEDAELEDTLLDPAARTFGFALTASGEGRKGAVALTVRAD